MGGKTTCRCRHVNTISSFQEIFGDTHVPIVLKDKLHTCLNIFIDNEMSTLNAILELIKFIITIEMLFYLDFLEDTGVPIVLEGNLCIFPNFDFFHIYDS